MKIFIFASSFLILFMILKKLEQKIWIKILSFWSCISSLIKKKQKINEPYIKNQEFLLPTSIKFIFQCRNYDSGPLENQTNGKFNGANEMSRLIYIY